MSMTFVVFIISLNATKILSFFISRSIEIYIIILLHRDKTLWFLKTKMNFTSLIWFYETNLPEYQLLISLILCILRPLMSREKREIYFNFWQALWILNLQSLNYSLINNLRLCQKFMLCIICKVLIQLINFNFI